MPLQSNEMRKFELGWVQNCIIDQVKIMSTGLIRDLREISKQLEHNDNELHAR
jgi:hypothetical protein